MLRNRFLFLLGLCFLAASAAWADDVGYVDCSKNADGTQVFAKPRKSPDVVASVPCGERFTVLVYGFFFSRIQTKDGQVGYVYSSVIAIDRAAAAAPQTPSLQTAAEKTKIPSTRAADAHAQTPGAAKTQTAAAQPAATPAAAAVTATPASSTSSSASTPNVADTVQTKTQANPAAADQPAAVQPATTSPAGLTTPATIIPGSTSSAADSAAPVGQPNVPAPETPSSASGTSASATTAVEATATDAQPTAPAAAEPTPAPAQPATPAIRPADTRDTWEKPLPSVRAAPLIELYGGYAFTRLDGGGGAGSNLNGALGSFGWNFKPWLQIVADTSYSFMTTGNTKNVIYGNHYGPRYFYRRPNRWGITPFVEGLVGGSRADTTISGVGGYSLSANCISFKVGGGLDIHPTRRWEIRLIDVDYYRTTFGTGAYQNNYWASAGVVLRLFGGRAE